MKPSNLLTQRRTVWTTVLLVMLLAPSLTGATPSRFIPGIASSSAHANAQSIFAPAPASAPASATSPKQEQMQAQSQQLGRPTTPLERALNKDGTLKLRAGFSGSLDPTGWRMQTGPNEQPRFITSSSSPLAPGDENWDNRFNTLGVDGEVQAIATSGTDVYVGGQFSTAGGVSASSIAKWDGSSWSALGSGLDNNGVVFAIAISGSDVYVGGWFTTAGGVSANNIAKWNGSTWSALGSGVGGSGDLPWVLAIGISGTDVYAGGRFTTAGGAPVNGIAKWDGSSWSALGNGVNARVSAIQTSGTDVYVGGGFTTAGGLPANRIAKWDGSNWSALSGGVGNQRLYYVNEIAISGSDVYASGWFTTAGGVTVNKVAKWDSSTWSALGSGVGGDPMNVVAYSVAVSGSDVYATGLFTTVGGLPANNVARWDGSNWSALGSGLTGSPSSAGYAIAVSGSDVYVGGSFTTAGVNVSNHFAIWHMPPVPPAVNLVGHVTWAGSPQPNASQMQPLTLTLCSTSGGPTSTYVANTNASGYFTVNVASLITGTYNWREKGPRSLANGGTITLTGGNQQAEMGVQNGGDADSDNLVGASDFNILKSTFGSATDLRADFNNDGVITVLDFSIMKNSFGQAGAPVTCP